MEEKTGKFQLLITTTSLYDAVLKGDMSALLEMLEEDPLILDRCMIENAGQLQQSPLHIAARKGNLSIVQTLLTYEPNICFTNDQYGRNPIHIASMYGHVEVLHELIHANPEASRKRTNDGETFLHLCINHGHKDALKELLRLTDGELLNAKDNDGNTVLHYAVRSGQHEMVRVILEDKRIQKNAMNEYMLTALDTHILLIETRKTHDHKSCFGKVVNWKNDDDIGPYLEDAKVLRAKDALRKKNTETWVENQSNGLMVVASLIATMAFTLGITPPGGAWSDTDPSKWDDSPPGVGIIYTRIKDKYINTLLIANAIAFCSSLSVILLLISGLPNVRYMVKILMVTMWIAMTATVLTYTVSILLITFGITKIAYWIPYISGYIWAGLVGLVIFSNCFQSVVKYIIRKRPLRSQVIESVRAVQEASHHLHIAHT